MYAITAYGYRSIAPGDPINPGETLVEQVPDTLLQAIASADTAASTNAASLRAQADAALADLRAYRDLVAPTNAQTAAIVKVLVKVAIGTIKLALGKLDTDN